MAMSPRDRRALILGAAGLAVIGVYFVGIEPLTAWQGRLRREHQTAAASIGRIIAEEMKAQSYAARIEHWEADFGALSPPKPYSQQITQVSEKIVCAAQQSGINLKGATPAAAMDWPAEPGLQRTAILIDAQAKWENVFKFIDAVYRIENVLSVEQMELTAEGKKGDTLNVKLNVSVLVAAPEQKDQSWPG